MSKAASKKDNILNALLALIKKGQGDTASVRDIAEEAGIAYGGLYYYFSSKEEVLDALVQREYTFIIDTCKKTLALANCGSFDKLKLLFHTYYSQFVNHSLDCYLHTPENSYIHQKSQIHILFSLSPLLEEILTQGAKESVFQCKNPKETSHIILSFFIFLLDTGVFSWKEQEINTHLQTFSFMLEKHLSLEAGSLDFLYKS